MKCSLSAVAVRGRAVLPQLVLAGANLGLAEAAAPQLHHGPLQLAGALPLQQSRRQLPVGALGEQRRNLAPRDPLLLVLQLPLEVLADRLAQLLLGLEVADFLQEFLGQLGQLQLLDVQHFEFQRYFLAAQLGVRRVLAERHLGRAAVARLRALHQFGEAFQPGVAEAQRRPNPHDRFRSRARPACRRPSP